MADYRPPTRFDTPVMLLTPTYGTYNGVKNKTYPDTGPMIMVSFRTFGGSEKVVNGIYSIENTATVETWYNPDIKAECRIVLDDVPYEIINDPEDINRRHQFLRFKVKAVGGGA